MRARLAQLSEPLLLGDAKHVLILGRGQVYVPSSQLDFCFFWSMSTIKPTCLCGTHSALCHEEESTQRAGGAAVRLGSSPETRTDWQPIFLQSKVNGASYNGDALDRHPWDWPKGTYFQRRFCRIKYLNSAEQSHSKRRTRF